MPLCFPIWDYMMLRQRTVSLKFCPMQAHPRAYVYIIYEKTKGKFPRENQVVWIGKTKHTSLRRSITLHWLTFQTPLSQVTYVVTGRRDHWREQLSSRRTTLSAQLLIKQLKFGYEFSGNISVTLKDFDCQLRIWREIFRTSGDGCRIVTPRACLHGAGGPQIGEVTCGGSPHLTCKRDHFKMRDYMDRGVTSPKQVTR